MESKETKWRVSEGDLKRNKEFARYEQMNEEMLRKTDTDYAPWTIIEATDKRYATAKIFTTVIHAMQMALEKVKMPEEAQEVCAAQDEDTWDTLQNTKEEVSL